MYKRIICVLFVIAFILIMPSCETTKKYYSDLTDINNETVTLDSLKNSSDFCTVISAYSFYETKTEKNKIYTTVCFRPRDWQENYMSANLIDATLIKGQIDVHPGQKSKTITIIEYDKSYIKPGNKYIVFLNKSEYDNTYYLSSGKSSLFTCHSGGDITPVDYKLKKEIKEYWNDEMVTFSVWFSKNYPEPPQVLEDTFENTTTNPNTTTNVS